MPERRRRRRGRRDEKEGVIARERAVRARGDVHRGGRRFDGRHDERVAGEDGDDGAGRVHRGGADDV